MVIKEKGMEGYSQRFLINPPLSTFDWKLKIKTIGVNRLLNEELEVNPNNSITHNYSHK